MLKRHMSTAARRRIAAAQRARWGKNQSAGRVTKGAGSSPNVDRRRLWKMHKPLQIVWDLR